MNWSPLQNGVEELLARTMEVAVTLKLAAKDAAGKVLAEAECFD